VSRADQRESWRRVWIVALREIRERGGSRAYRISTLVGILLVVGLLLAPALFQGSKTYRVGLVGDTAAGTVTALHRQADAADHGLRTSRYDTLAAGERAVRDKRVDVLLVDGRRLEWRTRADSTLTAVIAGAAQAVHIRNEAERLHVSTTQLAQLLQPVELSSRTLGATRTADQDASTVGFVAVGFLYVAVSFYAGFVLTGVVQEKANRVSEVLLARMPAREILAGKVLGIGAVGLAQFAIMGIAAAITAAVKGDPGVHGVTAQVLAGTCFWFVLGYLFYSVLYAGLGATTSRIEDAQAAIAPVTAILVLSYFAVIYAEENPDAPLTALLSYFPPTAPVVMTYRVAVHAVPAWQVITSAVVMIFAMWELIRLAGRIYSGGLLRFGPRVRLRELIGRAERSTRTGGAPWSTGRPPRSAPRG